MRRADRRFDISQALRTAPHPVTAAALAEQLEVTVRPRARICSAARFRSAALDVHDRGSRCDCDRRAPAAPVA